MIKVNKDFDAVPPSLLSESVERVMRAAQASTVKPTIDRNLYKKDDVKNRLRQIYQNKCAYCESTMEEVSYFAIKRLVLAFEKSPSICQVQYSKSYYSGFLTA